MNKAVKRNISRFPVDFMFQLSKDEYESLRFQTGILKRGRHSKYLPFAFTQEGVAMLSGVLNSENAIAVNTQIFHYLKTLLKKNCAKNPHFYEFAVQINRIYNIEENNYSFATKAESLLYCRKRLRPIKKGYTLS